MRGTVVALYARAAKSWQKAPAEIARGLRDARALHSTERRFVADALHGLVRMRRRLAFAAGLDEGEVASPSPDVLYLAWLAGADGEPPRDETAFAELARLGVARATIESASARLAAVDDGARRLALACSHPDWLVARLVTELGEARAESFLRASNRRARLVLRVNRLKNDREELIAALAKKRVTADPVALAPDALELRTHANAYGLAAFREGRFELQDTASQLVGEVVAPPPRGRVLDLCAGAGGKSLHLGALLGSAGRVVSCDVDAGKLEELRRRAGLSNLEAHAIADDGPLPPGIEGASFDRVLCDPCTGTGVLRRNPEARWRLGSHHVLELPRVQGGILERAAPRVAVGGRLVYATCSVLRDENDGGVDRFLAAHPGFEPVPVKEILGTERALMIGDGLRLRTAPDTHGCDGFFAAVMRRRA